MSFKLKLTMAVFVVLGAAGFIQGKSSALTTTGYYGSPVNASWFCNVLGPPNNNRNSTNCIDQGTGIDYQDYALQNFRPGSARCADTDSNCLKSQIELDIQGKLASGPNTYIEHTGASYIINTMLGVPAGRGSRDISAPQIADWLDRINNPAVTLQVVRGYPFGTPTAEVSNTAYDEFHNDIIKYPDHGSGDVLIFYENGAVKYIIKLDCGNPIGDLPGLTQYNPIQVSCGTIRVDPQRPESTDRITVYATVTFSGGRANPQATNQSMSISGVGNVGVTVTQTDAQTFTLKSAQFTVGGPGHYNVSWSVLLDTVAPNPNPCNGSLTTPGDSFDVFNYPYLSVTGGDVAAGVSFATTSGGVCGSSNQNAGISTWNKGAGSGFKGAGTQYGASTFSYIQDFITNQGNSGVGNGDTLSFANQDVTGINPDSDNPGAGRYGGYFKQGPCVDYWSKKPAAGTQSLSNPTDTDVGSLGDGIYVVGPGAQLKLHGSIPDTRRITIYVEGDVNVSGNITYANTAWATTGDIPIFKLVVLGKIFVNAGVGRMDGTYVAVPSSATYTTDQDSYASPKDGTISTCSSGFTVASPSVAPVNIGVCNNPLVVNGSFAANQIFFLRTAGTMSNGQPAEQFNFSPELWLAPDGTGSLDPAYKSIVGLPPVL